MSTFKINGKTLNIPNGRNISIINGDVFVDGVKLEETEPIVGRVILVVEGNLLNLKVTNGDVEVRGDIQGSVDCGGGCFVNGKVNGDVDAGGSITCGDIEGNVDAGGSVKCGKVGGDVDAGGSVKHG